MNRRIKYHCGYIPGTTKNNTTFATNITRDMDTRHANNIPGKGSQEIPLSAKQEKEHTSRVRSAINFLGKVNYRQLTKRSLWILKWCVIGFVSISISITILYSYIRPPITFLMIKRQFEYRHEKKPPKFRHHWVSIKNISPNLVLAVVASEDNNFTKHFGFDLEAIEKAEKHNKYHRRKHGASTISQQTAKNIFLWPSRTYIRKGFEVYFTLLIESFWTKRRIMEVYLNSIEMGPNIFGAEAASEYYFHKPASRLTRGEAALIAASLPNPIRRDPARPSGYMLYRQQHILYLMRMIGKVDL